MTHSSPTHHPVTHTTITRQVEQYYTGKLESHGSNHRGVDWNSVESQQLRFRTLLQVLQEERRAFSIQDVGCGYGALFGYMQEQGYSEHREPRAERQGDLPGWNSRNLSRRHGGLVHARILGR